MKEMTLQEVQRVSLDILKDVHAFCESHDIRYSLHYGTLIGAIRHKGFIPWDDDIDLVMPRPDYDRFCKEYKSSRGYTLYRPCDPGYFMTFARVCDNKDTIVKSINPIAKFETGIWIDIMPIDGLPSDETEFLDFVKEIRKFHPKIWGLRSGKYLKLSETGSIKRFVFCIIKRILFSHYNIDELLRKFTQLIQRYDFESADYYGQLPSADYPEKEHNPKEDFEYYIKMQFCNQDFYVMNGYNRILTRYYGNYMELPPENQRYYHSNNKYYWKC